MGEQVNYSNLLNGEKRGGWGGGMLLPYHSSSLNCEITPPSTIPHRKVDIKKYFYRIIILSLFLL